MVAERPDGDKVDWVVVELTGVADPGELAGVWLYEESVGVKAHMIAAEIARSFWTNEEMGGKLRLDGVVCVVDSKNIMQVCFSSRPGLL